MWWLPPADLVIAALSAVFGIRLIGVDVREHRLPDALTGGAAASIVLVAVGAAVWRGPDRLLPMVLCGAGMAAAGYLLAVVSPDGFGLGDVKLLGVIGLGLGHLNPQLVVVWLLALALASAVWLVLAPRLDKASDPSVPWRKRHIAFGPPMIAAWWISYLALAIATAMRT